MASNVTHIKTLTKLLGEKVTITGNKITFAESKKEIASFKLAGLPSCCGAGTLYQFKLRGKSEDGKVENTIAGIIENAGGRSWSYLQTTTRNPVKVKLFTEAGWGIKAKFESPKGTTYLFQKKVVRHRDSDDSDW